MGSTGKGLWEQLEIVLRSGSYMIMPAYTPKATSNDELLLAGFRAFQVSQVEVSV